jgi:hypothetical protein
MDLAGILLIALAVGLGILLFVAIALGWIPKNDGSGAAITVLHDLQPVDKQRATEIVIEQKAGKRWTEQESSDTDRKGGAEPKEGADSREGAASEKKDRPREGRQTHES